MAIFTQQEIERRRTAVIERMRTSGIQCAIAATPWNVYYLTGMLVMHTWGRPNVALVNADGRSCLIGPAGERLNAERNAWVDEIISFGDARNVLAAIRDSAADVLRRFGCEGKRLGFERTAAPHGMVMDLCEALRCSDGDVDPILSEARIVKSSEELGILRIGAEAAKVGMQACLDCLSEGATEADVAAAAQAAMHRYIAHNAPQMTSSPFAYINTGLNSLTPHLHPTGRRIQRGDIVALNVFPVVSGYLIELERTLIFGTPTPEQRRILSAVEEAFSAGKRAVRAGVRACDVDAVTRAVRVTHGFGEYTRGGTGHSHGILIGTNGREELGELRSYNTRPLQSGMVVSVEPGIYLPDVGAYRHSDVLVVTEQGADVITEFETPISVE